MTAGRAPAGVSAELIVDNYDVIFDEPMRAAHRGVMEFVTATRPDRWPTPAIVSVFAGLYRVSAAELGAFFGLLSYSEGGRVIWVDAVRGPTHPGVAQSRTTREQAIAFGFHHAFAEVSARETRQ